MAARSHRLLWLGGLAIAAAAMGAACGSGAKSNGKTGGNGASPTTSSGGGSNTGDTGGGDGGLDITNPTLTSIAISPSLTTINVTGGATGTQQLQLVGKYSDASTQTLTGAAWTSDQLSVGAIDSTGLYTANGTLGGAVHVQATYMGLSATATVTVKLTVQENPAMAAASVQASLQGASAPDASVVWAYPYDATVWPRGLTAPVLQWNGGAATDVYYVHVVSPTYELQQYATSTGAPSSQLAMSATDWTQLTESTAGPTTFTVARWNGTSATVIAKQTWTIASASMRGTIYYWANNLGRIMRLDPGGSAPTDFSSGVVPTPTQGCSMACHTVAAGGSAMTVAGGTFGGTYNLQSNTMGYSVGAGENSGPIRQWGLASISPKGDIVVANALMDPLTNVTADGIFHTADGTPVTNSGLSTESVFMPAFSPDGTGFVFITGSFPNAGYWLATGAPGPTAPTDPAWGWLKAYDFNDGATPMFTNERQLVGPGTDPTQNVIAWPTVSADGSWVIYSRLGWVDPSLQHNLSSYPGPSGPDVNGDLYLASTKTAGAEVRLANLDGDNTTFAAGARDMHLNFEPSAAPVASGGYFWVVLHSRRTYGNTLTGDRSTVKQLWVAAIDQNPTPGKDPSHPAFWLPGQDTTTLNLRGYWSLPPCAQDGQGCTTGTDCCGGYCTSISDGGTDGGTAVCQSMSTGCSQDGNACTKSSDCCDATSTCINHVCSESTPQ
jgi:hypothetical protein